MQICPRTLRRITCALALSALVFGPLTAHAQSPCSQGIAGPGCPPQSLTAAQGMTVTSATQTGEAVTGHWTATRDGSLRDLLTQWSTRAGWQEPTWTLKPDEDFTLGASMGFDGDFAGAVTALFDAFPPETKLRVRLYLTNRLMIVEQAS